MQNSGGKVKAICISFNENKYIYAQKNSGKLLKKLVILKSPNGKQRWKGNFFSFFLSFLPFEVFFTL